MQRPTSWSTRPQSGWLTIAENIHRGALDWLIASG
jgi:hypothetical protein